MDEKMATRATVVMDGGFGKCSICSTLHLAKVGKLEFGFCLEHRIFWEIGSNNSSAHWQMALNQMRATAQEMHGFRLVGYRRVGIGWLCVDEDGVAWDAADAVEAFEEWFEGFFELALKVNPSLTREQLENMTIDEMKLENEDGGRQN
jgi:hypothetical protein